MIELLKTKTGIAARERKKKIFGRAKISARGGCLFSQNDIAPDLSHACGWRRVLCRCSRALGAKGGVTPTARLKSGADSLGVDGPLSARRDFRSTERWDLPSPFRVSKPSFFLAFFAFFCGYLRSVQAQLARTLPRPTNYRNRQSSLWNR